MITVFYTKTQNINQTYTVIYEELSLLKNSKLRVIDIADLELDDIIRLSKESDLVAVDNSINVANLVNRKKISTVIYMKWRGTSFYNNAFNAILNSGRKLLYIASGWDLHWLGPENLHFLEKISALAWMFEKKPVTLSELPAVYRDKWMEAHKDPLENWHKVRQKVPIRIELLHSIGDKEFAQHPYLKLWDICISGTRYATRKIVKQAAIKEKLLLAPFRHLGITINAITALPSIFLPITMSKLRNRLMWQNQKTMVRHSKINFVCGSGYRYITRKFFEIPASYSPMIAYPCMGLDDYGFKDGENAIFAPPEDVGKTARKLINNERYIKRMSINAWNTVIRLHSAKKRAADLVKCMERLAKGNLKNAQFIDGEFIIN